MGQPKVLDYLDSHNGAMQKDIASACNIEPGSLTAILNRMEDKELIIRKTLNNNRRTYHIFITEKGKELQKKVKLAFAKLEDQAFVNISKEQRELFMDIFTKIHDNMKQGRDGSHG